MLTCRRRDERKEIGKGKFELDARLEAGAQSFCKQIDELEVR